MAPELIPAVAILGCVVLILGAFIYIHILGRSSRQPEIDGLKRELASEKAARKKAEASASKRAHGATGDTADAVDRALAGDDFDRVLDTIDDDGSDPTSGEHGQGGDAGGTQGGAA